jgi:hypothetical protein
VTNFGGTLGRTRSGLPAGLRAPQTRSWRDRCRRVR